MFSLDSFSLFQLFHFIKQQTSYIINYTYQSEAKEMLFHTQQEFKGLR